MANGGARPERVPRTLGHVAGLDGLRGLAVAAVVAYHLWPASFPGGFIGVSVFFALSGFLITSLLLQEVQTTGTLSFRRFYARRVRRIVPASLATLALVAVVWTITGWRTRSLTGEMFYALGQIANWGQVLARVRYGTADAPSPVQHFWSLAIEEQIYLFLPLLVLWCRTRRRVGVMFMLLLGGSVVAIIDAAGATSRSYFSTFTRSSELLVGALAAVLLHGRQIAAPRRLQVPVIGSGIIALGALAWVAATMHVSDPIVSRGALLGCALAATVAIAAATTSPMLGRWLDVAPLARLGRVSYAVYLVHWPLILALQHAHLHPLATASLTVLLTIAIATASGRWFERPIRLGRVRASRLAFGLGAAALVVGGFALVPRTDPASVDFEAAARVFQHRFTPDAASPPVTDGSPSDTSATPGTAPGPTPLRIGFFGDSKAMALGWGTGDARFPDISVGASFAPLGCPIGRGGAEREPGQPPVLLGAECDWATGIAGLGANDARSLDAAVVWSGTWDIADRKVPALGGGWTNIDQATYRAWLLGELEAFTDTITRATGAAKVFWLTLPVDPSSLHPERFQRWTEMLALLAAERPDTVAIIDMAAFIEQSGERTRLLPDGVHPTFAWYTPTNTAAEIFTRLIRPALAKVLAVGPTP